MISMTASTCVASTAKPSSSSVASGITRASGRRIRPSAGDSMRGSFAQMWPGCVPVSCSLSWSRRRRTVPTCRVEGDVIARTGPEGPPSTFQAPSMRSVKASSSSAIVRIVA